MSGAKSSRDETAPGGLGTDLVAALRKLGYEPDRQRGSHIRITTHLGGEHHEVVSHHHPIRIGALSGILKSVAAYHALTVEELPAKFAL